MKTFFLAIGVNRYKDKAYPELLCCENDATELQALFKRGLNLGDRARKLVGAVSKAVVFDEIERIGGEIRNGDTFIFFFAGHGYGDENHEDQFMLFPDAVAKLVNKGFRDGMLSLSALCALTDDWIGVTRIFILDTCRELLNNGRRGSNLSVFNNEEGLAYVVSRSPGFSPALNGSKDPSVHDRLQPIVLNATRNGQFAREVQDLGRGALSLALERSLEEGIQSGKPVWLDGTMLTEIEQHMRGILAQASFSEAQAPVLFPSHAKALLFKPERPASHYQLKALRERFELQFSRADFDTPWGECCNHTLAQLSAHGMPAAELQVLQSRLHTAMEQQQQAQQESAWAALLTDFERQLQAGKLETPSTDNCRETLLLLRTSDFPANRLAPLGQRLQNAIDQRQAQLDRDHDDRLIKLMRQHRDTPLGKNYAQTYLSTARGHDYDDEAHAIISAAEASAHDTPHNRDEKRRRETQQINSLAAWEQCRHEAETAALREYCEIRLQEFHQQEIEAAKKRDDAKRQEMENRDQSRIQRAIETNTFQAWEECWLNAETSAVKETAKSRMAALKAKDAADKEHDSRLLAAAKRAGSAEAWAEVRYKAIDQDLRQSAEREIASIKQRTIDESLAREQEQRDHARFMKAQESNTLAAWITCRQDAETEKLKETANSKITALEAEQRAENDRDAKLLAEAEKLGTTEAWKKVFKKARRGEVRDRARQEIARIAAEAKAALMRDEKRAAALPDPDTPLASWRKLLAEMETGWGKSQANEAIETLIANDQAAWKQTSADNTAAAYQHYLDSQPEGKWRYEARTRIVSIKAHATKTPDEGNPPEKRFAIGNLVVPGLGVLALSVFYFYPKPALQPASVVSTSTAPTSTPASRSTLDKAPGNQAESTRDWEEQARTIQASPWWKTVPDKKPDPMTEDQTRWVKQTIKYATAAQPLPLAQLMLASLQCRGIAAPQVALDPQACGKTLAATLNNPQLPAGTPGDKVDDGVGLLFDKWVPVSGPAVNRAFAQVIAPGLEARKTQYPMLALRLALVQACYLQPTDRSAATKTLNGIKTTAQGAPAKTAARMLDDLNKSKEPPSWCRS